MKGESKADKKIHIELNDSDEIYISDERKTIDQTQKTISDFLKTGVANKVIEISISKKTSYELFVKLLDLIDDPINELRNELANSEFNLNYAELTNQQKLSIDKKAPKNVVVNEPK